MATVGLKKIFLAVIDPKTQQIILPSKDSATKTFGLGTDGLLEVTDEMLGSKTANISNIEGAVSAIQGNNHNVDASIAKGNPAVELDFNNLPFLELQKMLGRTADGKGGFVKTGAKPHVALIVNTETIDRASNIYYGFANGVLSQTALNNATDTDAETRADDTLTYQSLAAKAFDGEQIKFYLDSVEGFKKDDMFKEVMGGYTPATPAV